MLKRTGIIIGIIGIVCGTAGVAWYSLQPTVDANIGAGLLVVVGLAMAAIGVVIVAVSLLTSTQGGRGSPDERASRQRASRADGLPVASSRPVGTMSDRDT